MNGGNGDANVNPYRGDVAITLGGRNFVLRLSTNVLCSIEAALGCGGGELAQMLTSPSVKAVRATFHAALTTPDRNGVRAMSAETTPEQVGWLIDEAGGIAHGSPASCAYFELLAYGPGWIDVEIAQRAGLIRPGKSGAGPDVPADGAPAETTTLASSAGT